MTEENVEHTAVLAAKVNAAAELIRTDPSGARLQLEAIQSEVNQSGYELQVDHLIALSRCGIVDGNVENGVAAVERALEIATENNDQHRIARSLNNRGVLCLINSEFQEAQDSYSRALKIVSSLNDDTLRLSLLLNLANLRSRLNDFDDAMETYFEAKDLAVALGDSAMEAKILTNMATIYVNAYGDPESALELNDQALKIVQERNDNVGVAIALGNRAHYLRLCRRLDEAFQQITVAFQRYKDLGIDRDAYHVLFEKVAVLIELKRFEEAEQNLDLLTTVVSRQKSAAAQALLQYATGLMAMVHEDYEQAVACFERALGPNYRDPDEKKSIEIMLCLAEAKSCLGRFEDAQYCTQWCLAEMAKHASKRLKIALVAMRREVDIVRAESEAAIHKVRTEELRDIVHKLRASDEDKNRLIRFLAHELKEPLSSIRSLASTDDVEDANAVRETLRLIKAISDQLSDLTVTVLDHVRGLSSEERQQSVHIAPIWMHLMSIWSRRASSKGQVFHCTDVEEDVIVCGSERQLLTVFENVISNAVKYTPEGGIISVVHRTDLEGGFFSVWVKDSGPGMRSSDALTFGQPFVTGNAVPTGGESSTGLGLFLATKEVAALGGTIHVEDGETGGTVFSITIPLCRINER